METPYLDDAIRRHEKALSINMLSDGGKEALNEFKAIKQALRTHDVSSRFSSNDVDLSYCCGVFNVVGIDGLSDELKRLKEINKKPHEIFNFIPNDR